MTDVIIAQTCTVRGKVTTDHDGEAASFAIVSIQNLEQRTICDIDGRFELRNIPTGKHTIEVECLGFVKLKQQFTAIKDTNNSAEDMQDVNERNAAGLTQTAFPIGWRKK